MQLANACNPQVERDFNRQKWEPLFHPFGPYVANLAHPRTD